MSGGPTGNTNTFGTKQSCASSEQISRYSREKSNHSSRPSCPCLLVSHCGQSHKSIWLLTAFTSALRASQSPLRISTCMVGLISEYKSNQSAGLLIRTEAFCTTVSSFPQGSWSTLLIQKGGLRIEQDVTFPTGLVGWLHTYTEVLKLRVTSSTFHGISMFADVLQTQLV